MDQTIDQNNILLKLARHAWKARNQAYILGETKVGCALLDENNKVHIGCNVEHKFRSHDVHAEVNAITNMIVGGGKAITAIIVVAEREKFTPCGACMDWIMQFGISETIVGFQNTPVANIEAYSTTELMPHYPA